MKAIAAPTTPPPTTATWQSELTAADLDIGRPLDRLPLERPSFRTLLEEAASKWTVDELKKAVD